MKNHKKDYISDSCESDSKENLLILEKNECHENFKNANTLSVKSGSGCDSNSDNECSGNFADSAGINYQSSQLEQNSKNDFSSTEFNKKDVRQGKSVLVKSIFNVEDLTSYDEVYTLQCPETFNKQMLLDKKINLRKPKHLFSNETEEFHFEMINSENKFITLAVPKKTDGAVLVKLPLKGHIVIHRVLDLPAGDFMNEDIHSKSKVVFPQQLKIRHPLLGVDWKAHMELAKEANKKKKYTKKYKTENKEKPVEIKLETKKLKRESPKVEIHVHKKKKKHV